MVAWYWLLWPFMLLALLVVYVVATPTLGWAWWLLTKTKAQREAAWNAHVPSDKRRSV